MRDARCDDQHCYIKVLEVITRLLYSGKLHHFAPTSSLTMDHELFTNRGEEGNSLCVFSSSLSPLKQERTVDAILLVSSSWVM